MRSSPPSKYISKTAGLRANKFILLRSRSSKRNDLGSAAHREPKNRAKTETEFQKERGDQGKDTPVGCPTDCKGGLRVDRGNIIQLGRYIHILEHCREGGKHVTPGDIKVQ